MNFSKLLLIVLSLWISVAPIAAAGIVSAAESAASSDENSSVPDEAAGSQLEEYEGLLTSSIVPLLAPLREHLLDLESLGLLDGHLAEPLLPPPNPSRPR